ncbi:hypothetical protein CACET_c27910 [Clostridium aceticum]|uniref:Uncharacterized protein n=1 Tax=Clostridium aceticum TaxID=84022 RepID=A0A0D8I8M2_9CLOT|nr:hypothetical protein [Clostridium aceticum]AKL96236.1 hypothetical protein CACET_c27910 [Clostridium aceticum]KJF26645.1 hypothetical protein TZ02_12305 [Clostridium aceticum]
MKNRRLIVVFLIIIIIALVIFIYTRQKDQGQQQQVESYEEDVVTKTSSSEEVIDTDISIGDDLIADVVDILDDGSGSGYYGEPAAKLDPAYETAMENSDLAPFEKELIRLIVEKEGKSFEEALQSVRPGARVVEQGETETSSGNQNTEKPSNNNNGNNSKPTTPTKPPKQDNTTPKTNEGDSGGADFNNPDTRTPEQKEADANDPFSGGSGYQGGPGGDVSHEPDF